MLEKRLIPLDFALRYRIWYLLLALLQNMLAAGLIYGWSALSVLLLRIGAFSWECNDTSPCEAQRRKLHFIYTFAQSANLLGSLVSGIVLDRFGPRFCSAVSLSGVSIGMVLMGVCAQFQTQHSLDGYLAALMLLGFSGPGVQVSLFHLSNLFPGHAEAIAVLISGSFQISFTVFLVFKTIHHVIDGVSFQFICYIYGTALLVLSLVSLVVWPDAPFEAKDSSYLPLDAGEESDEKSFMSQVVDQMRTAKFQLLAFWMVLCVFWANYYIGTISDQLVSFYGEDKSSSYVDQFNLLTMVGTALIPFFCWYIDKLGFGSGFLLTNITGVLFSIVALFHNLRLQTFTFILYSCFRTFVFSSVFAYIGSEFGFKLFGSLSGILFLVASVVCIIQYWMVRFFHADYESINFIMLICIVVTTVFPIYVLWNERKDRQRRKVMALDGLEESNL